VHFDLRYAVRQLLKSPGFTLIAVVGLGLGIGANIALFSVVNSIFLRPLPYREPGRLVRLTSSDEAHNLRRVGFSHTRYVEVQQRQQVFSDLALSAGNAFTLTGRGDPEQVIAIHASASLLPALGLEPVLGRNSQRAKIVRVARRSRSSAIGCGRVDSTVIRRSSDKRLP